MPFWSRSGAYELAKARGDHEGAELKGERGDGAAESGQVVLVVRGDLLDRAVAAEALEDA